MALIDNIRAYWKCDENTGTTINDEIGSQDGTLTNTTWTTGKINSGLSFDGNGDYVSLGTLNLTPSNSWSFSCWVKTTNTTQEQYVFARDGGGANQVQYVINIYNNQISFRVGTQTQTLRAVSNLCDGNWKHIVCTTDGTTPKIYVNGTYINTGDKGTYTYSTTTYLGQRSDGYGDFHGQLDEIGIWDKTLTSDEVSQLYNSGNGLTYPFTTSNIKTVNGLTYASVKTVNGLATSSIKTINGLA